MFNEVNPEKMNSEIFLKQIPKHCQKITEALYKVTDVFSDKEPLKWILRNESVETLKVFVSVESASPQKRAVCFNEVSEKINQIIRLIEVASQNSYIVSANLNVIKTEYEKLNDFIKNEFVYFEVSEISDLKATAENSNSIGHNGQLLIEHNGQENKEMSVMSDRNIPVMNMGKIDDNKAQDRILNKINGSADNHYKNITERAGKILEIINSKEDKRIGVQEVFSHFKGISKKTIQRELQNLVREGCLKMEGEKRWRIYKRVN